jgi:hypothetical protein
MNAASRIIAAMVAAVTLALATPPVGVATAADDPLPPDALVLLVASWCAPCHEQLTRLDALAAAARPRRLVVAAVDDGPRTTAMVKDVPAPMLLRLRPRGWLRLPAGAPGLPFAILTDRQGQPCATTGRAVMPTDVTALAARCAAR